MDEYTQMCVCVHISSKMTYIMFFQSLYFSFMFYLDIGIKHILSALLFPHTGYFLFTFSPGSIFLKLFSYKYIQNNNIKGNYFKYIMYFFLYLIYWNFFCSVCFDHFHLSHKLSGPPFLLYLSSIETMFLGI